MSNKTVFALVAVLALTGVAAMADMTVDFGISELNLTYTAATQSMTIESTLDPVGSNGSTLEAELMNDGALLNSLQIDQDNFTGFSLYKLTLAFTQNGANDWGATGTLSLRDATGAEVVAADFVSTNVQLVAGVMFWLDGSLSPVGINEGVLVPSVSAWSMTDGVSSIDVANATRFSGGTMLNTQFNTFTPMSEDEFFGSDRSLDNGDSNISITPVPAGVLLGIIGLGMVGARMRKYA